MVACTRKAPHPSQPPGIRQMSRHARASRVLILSDTHGRLHPEIAALAEDVDVVVHAGDIGHPEVLARLAAGGAALVAVRGNNDTHQTWPADDHATLEALPLDAQLALPGGTLAVEHGHRANPVARRHALLRERHVGARLVVYGHSHRPCIDDSASPTVANPGAAGRSRTFGGSGCILLTASTATWRLTSRQFALDTWNS